MFTRLNAQHDILIGHHGTDRINASTQRLTERDDIRTNAVVLTTEHTTSTAEACLNLIADKEYVVLLAKGVHLLEVCVVWHHNTSLSLDWFEKHGSCFVPILCEHGLNVLSVVVTDRKVIHDWTHTF